MTCTKTGATIYLEPYHAFAHGDAFELGDVAYFRIVQTHFLTTPDTPVHYTVHDYVNWFDRGKDISTLITTRFVNHGYEGIPLQREAA